jgi:hypothetical protein
MRLFRRTSPVTELAQHPNAATITEVVRSLGCLQENHLYALARAWHNDTSLSSARALALDPDSPLVLDVLREFDRISSLAGTEGPYGRVPVATVRTALNALRDAVAAAYAQPRLSRRSYQELLAPWNAAFPDGARPAVDSGP